jgi:hypothetical protein
VISERREKMDKNEQLEGVENGAGLTISSKIVVNEMRSIRSMLAEWIKAIDVADKGSGRIDVRSFRAEISLCAAKLESLVQSEL